MSSGRVISCWRGNPCCEEALEKYSGDVCWGGIAPRVAKPWGIVPVLQRLGWSSQAQWKPWEGQAQWGYDAMGQSYRKHALWVKPQKVDRPKGVKSLEKTHLLGQALGSKPHVRWEPWESETLGLQCPMGKLWQSLRCDWEIQNISVYKGRITYNF